MIKFITVTWGQVGGFFRELRFPPPIKLIVMKQEVYGFISTLPTSTLNTKYIWAVFIKLHDSATYDGEENHMNGYSTKH